MNNIEKYKILVRDKPYSYCVRMALLLLNSDDVYEQLKEESSKIFIGEGDTATIFERIIKELLAIKFWYLPDEIKMWDRRFGDLFKVKFFCYDDDFSSWSKVLEKYFVELDWMPKKEDFSSKRSFNGAWEYFAELLAVVKVNNHPDFEHYYEIAIQKGMEISVFEKKIKELMEIRWTLVQR